MSAEAPQTVLEQPESAEPAPPAPIEHPNLIAALVAARAEMPAIAKNRHADAGQYGYDFADLADVLEAAQPVLTRHGLVLVQDLVGAAGGVSITTKLLHISGEMLVCGPLTMATGSTAQAMGSSITYGRRYTALAALGLAPARAEDDDAKAADARPAERYEPERAPARPLRPVAPSSPAPPPARTAAEASMRAMLAGLAPNDAAVIRARFIAEFATNLSGLDPTHHDDALRWLTVEIEDLGQTAEREPNSE